MAPLGYTVDDVVYDPVTHTSALRDGRPVPHVTAILEATGVSTDFEALAEMGPRVAERIEAAGLRGTAVHADCHAYDDDDLDLAQCHAVVRPYVEAWVTCRDSLGLVALAHARERRVYHPGQNYTGILDGIFMRFKGYKQQRILLDLKTGDPESAAAHLQTAAYEAAWNLAHPDQKVNERWAVWLRPGRPVQYTIINYTAAPDAWQDFARFQAVLCTYNEQPSRRARRS